MLVNTETGELFLYGPIGPKFFEDGITAESVVEALAEIGNRPAIVRVNSPGGSVNDGIAIYHALRRHAAGVEAYIDSLAASIASVIPLAAERRVTNAGSRWMVHRAMTFAMGNVNDMRQAIDALEAGDRALLEIYGSRLGKDAAEVEALMDRETWFTSQEAIDFGLATEHGDEEAKEPAVMASWFENAPADLKLAAKTGQVATVHPKVPVMRNEAELRSRLIGARYK